MSKKEKEKINPSRRINPKQKEEAESTEKRKNTITVIIPVPIETKGEKRRKRILNPIKSFFDRIFGTRNIEDIFVICALLFFLGIMLFMFSTFIGYSLNRFLGINEKCYLWEAILLTFTLYSSTLLFIRYYFPEWFGKD